MNPSPFENCEKIFQSLLDPCLRLYLKPEWGANFPQSRIQIRESIFEQSKGSVKSDILDLAKLPLLKSGFCSVAHCPNAGGFVTGPLALGFDLELSARIKQSTADRVSSKLELQNWQLQPQTMPSPVVLWTAKESLFKALTHYQQPNVLSQIETHWPPPSVELQKLKLMNCETSQIEIFELKNSKTFAAPAGKGCVIQCGEYTMAIFIFRA